jgi:hypothetical protein
MKDNFYTQNVNQKNARFNIEIQGKIRLIVCVMLCAVALNLATFVSSAYAKQIEYAGDISFEKSKNVKIHFYISEDASKVEKISFTMDELFLKPKDEKSGIDNVVIQDAGLTDESVYEIADGRLRSDNFFVFDLTVIDSCVYGTISINYEIDSGVVTTGDPVYTVIPNVTTPKVIPQNILKP